MSTLLVMAGGTGGHVMPALAAARELRERGVEVVWMGTREGLESRLVPAAGFDLETIEVSGLRRSGLRRKLAMPWMLANAGLQAWRVIRRRRPDGMLGMGGFAAGPGGVMGVLRRLPLVIHEQNAVAGLTNRLLAKVATRVLLGFPEATGFDPRRTRWVGNPVRREIAAVEPPGSRLVGRSAPFRVLVIGGSQGARVFNEKLPGLLGKARHGIEAWHQCGRGDPAVVEARYREAGVACRVTEFIDDMAGAYQWSDLVVCRAGAMTVAEVCAAGAVALFVPYPHAVGDHQAANAGYLVSKGAALMVREEVFTGGEWVGELDALAADRKRLLTMAGTARALARPRAAGEVADACLEVMNA